MALVDWMAESHTGFKAADLQLTEKDSLSFADFEAFCRKRREALLQRLRDNVEVTTSLPLPQEVLDEEEELTTSAE
ncbi:hypothetical protein [Paraburkholderia sp. GAS32]|uniref:hypothetical protein n=1 Tax=Paraburkholderia sp. GAS32 TaxID=3035129 RepID=UPI003D1A0C2E